MLLFKETESGKWKVSCFSVTFFEEIVLIRFLVVTSEFHYTEGKYEKRRDQLIGVAVLFSLKIINIV